MEPRSRQAQPRLSRRRVIAGLAAAAGLIASSACRPEQAPQAWPTPSSIPAAETPSPEESEPAVSEVDGTDALEDYAPEEEIAADSPVADADEWDLADVGADGTEEVPTEEVPPGTPTSSAARQGPSATPVPRPKATAESPPTATPRPPVGTPTVRRAASTPRPTSTPLVGRADLAVVHGSSPATITRAAVDAIGGIRRFVGPGQVVVIKPNICTAMAPQYAATTNPEVVAALVTLCREAGAGRVKVLDYGWGGQRTAYQVSGIQAAVQRAGGEMVAITPVKWKRVDIPGAKLLKSVEIFDDVLRADVLINVPIAKDHGLSRLTLGMKNLMGVVSSREQFHGSLGQYLSDLMLKVRPRFTLIDAVRILTDNGPGGGSLSYVKRLNTVVASADTVAADAYSTRFFGLRPSDIETIRTGARNGLGTSDLSRLKIAEVWK